MIPTSWSRLLGVLLLAAVTACAPPPRPGFPVATTVGDALLESWRANVHDVVSLSGLAKARVQGPEGSFSSRQVILAARPDRLRVESLSPFGTPLLLLAADGTTLSVSVPSQGAFYQGAASAENLGRFFRVPMRLEDLIDILLYRAPLLKASSQEVLELHGEGWLVRRSGERQVQELQFDTLHRLTATRYFADGVPFLEVVYGGFGATGTLPTEFAIELPGLETRARLEFEDDLSYNKPPRAELFRIAPSAGARIIELDTLHLQQASP